MSLNNWPLLGSHYVRRPRQLPPAVRRRRRSAMRCCSRSRLHRGHRPAGASWSGWPWPAFCSTHGRGVRLIRAAVIAPVTIGFATASYLWLSLLDPSPASSTGCLLDIHVAEPLGQLAEHVRRWRWPWSWLVTVWKLAGFAMIVLINGLQSVPADVEEAARVDGARRLRVLWSIKLPLMRRSIVLALVFVALAGLPVVRPVLHHDRRRARTTARSPPSSVSTTQLSPKGNLGYASAHVDGPAGRSCLIITAPGAGACSHEEGRGLNAVLAWGCRGNRRQGGRSGAYAGRTHRVSMGTWYVVVDLPWPLLFASPLSLRPDRQPQVTD